MFGKILTENNEYLLKIIFNFGGYIRQTHTKCIYPEISYRARSAKLLKLCEMGYLTQKKLYTNSDREPTVYKVTTKTCEHFGKKDSNIRKNHKEEYILRALLKSEFLCKYFTQFAENLETDNDKKIGILVKNGCRRELIPTIKSPTQTMNFVEEPILDFTDNENRPLIFTHSGNILGGPAENITFVYPDKRTWDVAEQTEKLSLRYLDICGSSRTFGVTFLVLVDSLERKNAYEEVLSGHDFHARETQIRRDVLKIYLNYLAKRKEEILAALRMEIDCATTNDIEKIIGKLDTHFKNQRANIVTIDTAKHRLLIEHLASNGIESMVELIKKSDENQHLFSSHDDLFECILSLVYGAGLHAVRGKNAIRYAIEII